MAFVKRPHLRRPEAPSIVPTPTKPATLSRAPAPSSDHVARLRHRAGMVDVASPGVLARAWAPGHPSRVGEVLLGATTSSIDLCSRHETWTRSRGLRSSHDRALTRAAAPARRRRPERLRAARLPLRERAGRGHRVEEPTPERAWPSPGSPNLEHPLSSMPAHAPWRGARRDGTDRRPTGQSSTPRRTDADRWVWVLSVAVAFPGGENRSSRQTGGPLAVMRVRAGHWRERRRH